MSFETTVRRGFRRSSKWSPTLALLSPTANKPCPSETEKDYHFLLFCLFEPPGNTSKRKLTCQRKRKTSYGNSLARGTVSMQPIKTEVGVWTAVKVLSRAFLYVKKKRILKKPAAEVKHVPSLPFTSPLIHIAAVENVIDSLDGGRFYTLIIFIKLKHYGLNGRLYRIFPHNKTLSVIYYSSLRLKSRRRREKK